MGQGLLFALVRDGAEVWRAYGSDPGGLPEGRRVWVESVSGWMGEPGPARTEGRTSRRAGGSIPLRRVGLDGRTITLSGWAEPPSDTDIDGWALAQPGRIFPSDQDPHELVLWSRGHGVDVHALVELDGQCTFRPDHGTGLVDWQIPLHAPDVYLLGDETSALVHNSVDGVGLLWPLFDSDPPALQWGEAAEDLAEPLRNPGSVAVYPTVTVSGNALSGVRLSDGAGHTVTFTGACTYASPVVIDFGAGTARRGTADFSAQLTGRGFWQVPAGGVVLPVAESLQSGTTVQADFRLTPRYL